jgi:hypothetical protein
MNNLECTGYITFIQFPDKDITFTRSFSRNKLAGVLMQNKLWMGKHLELYYKLNMFNNRFSVSPDYQFVLNPAYNKYRGPVQLIGLRFHTEW